MPRSVQQCLADLRTRGFDDLASSVETLSIVTESLRALTVAHFPAVLDGSSEQAEIVLALLPIAISGASGGDEEDEGPEGES